jgi:hypothetical protein
MQFFRLCESRTSGRGLVARPKGLATGSGQRRSGAAVRGAVVRIHGGGQRGAVLSRVEE